MDSENGKNLSFEILCEEYTTTYGPRLGKLSIRGRRPIETPNFFGITSRGVIPHITPDVMASHIQVGGVHIALEDIIKREDLSTSNEDSSLHEFAAVPRRAATLLAPRRTPAVLTPNGNSNSSITIFALNGFQEISNKNYISLTHKLSPDIAIAMADVPYGSGPGVKRVAKMVRRTQAWLSETIHEKAENQAIFAPILPLQASEQSEYLEYVSNHASDKIDGLALYRSNVLQDIPATISTLRLPRLTLDEPSSPLDILRKITIGIDIFTVPFISNATDAGFALTFSFHLSPQFDGDVTKKNGKLPLGTDMCESVHSRSLIPLSDGCDCYTCSHHHRAYVQHLLCAKEMLGWVLLQVHNHHILFEFFRSVRKSISSGCFLENCEKFAELYSDLMPEKTRKPIRIKGYHYKKEDLSREKVGSESCESTRLDKYLGLQVD
ncbi:tRNA-guanine transglycosylase family protein [Blumeria hordei DH14]|uniref:Queuine tRNA-ribosyltransferase accessory subunit 2 n=1 Tax=Blumeria graminis f. sp. hordei (strain DH14) TaxID=546991 RepID=N1JEP1_BLUG1|nr:tRNA-guanine transglycosylase family protein [Blumeria hordei DH14]